MSALCCTGFGEYLRAVLGFTTSSKCSAILSCVDRRCSRYFWQDSSFLMLPKKRAFSFSFCVVKGDPNTFHSMFKLSPVCEVN